MRKQVIVLATALVLAPLGAGAADLVVWWDQGYYAQEDQAVREIIAAFEQKTGKQVELSLYPLNELPSRVTAALQAGRPPDFAFGGLLGDYIGQWAFDDRLVDLTDTVGSRTCSIWTRSHGGHCPTEELGRERSTRSR